MSSSNISTKRGGGKKRNLRVLNRSLESITKDIEASESDDSLISSGHSSSMDDNSLKSGGSEAIINPQQTTEKKSSNLLGA